MYKRQLLREPRRGSQVAQASAAIPEVSIADVSLHLKLHARAYLALIGSMSMLAILGYGTMAWYPEFLMRTYGMDRATAGGQLGVILLVAGSLGTLAGGRSVQPLARRGRSDAPLLVILACSMLWLVPAVLGPLAANATLAVLAACPIIFFLNAYFGVGITGVQLITPTSMRAQVSALMLFSTNLFGLAFGPSAVAILTDFAFGNDLALRYSLALLPLVVCPVAAGLVWQGMRGYREAVTPT